MSTLVVDASVAAKWFLPEDLSDTARRILRSENRLYAPDYLLLEMDNVFCRRIRQGDLKPRDGEEARVLLRQLPLEYYAFAPLQNRAYALANRTRCSIYDALYVALAILLGGRMVTADRKLLERLSDSSVRKHTVWIADDSLT